MSNYIVIKGAKEHNLKDISINIPKDRLVVITGVSGSGKSSLAFDTIYAEGKRRYVESLSSYARQFLEVQGKPNVESIEGLSPAIAIDQKTTSRNPRSTVATATEIYDYMRVLYARIGIPYSPATNLPIEKQTVSQMVEKILQLPVGSKIYIMAPIAIGQKGEYRKDLLSMIRHGYERVKIDGSIYELQDLPAIDKNKKHDISIIIDRLELEEDLGHRLADSIETALKLADGVLQVEIISIEENEIHHNGDILIFSENFSCPVSGFSLTEIEPRIFSFNSHYGACPHCNGLGMETYFDTDLIVLNPRLSIVQGAIAPLNKAAATSVAQHKIYEQVFSSLAKHYQFSLDTPFGDLPEEIKKIIFYGSGTEIINFVSDDGFKKSTVKKYFEGVVNILEKRVQRSESANVEEEVSHYKMIRNCSACQGYRLRAESLCVRVVDKHIGEICRMNITEAMDWFAALRLKLSVHHQQIAERVIIEIVNRLGFLKNVGLEYLTLDRRSNTLSGGESQRIRLASQIGSGLSGVLYVLDEPSIGLHQRDNDKLLHTLFHLRDLGNTVIVVEHDMDTMRVADHLIDIGPGAGVHGGQVLAEGTPEEVAINPNSLTGQYLSKKLSITIQPYKSRPKDKFIRLTGARANNLKNVSISVPLSNFVVFTGVSGSGKSSLVIQTLYRAAMKKLHNSKVIPGEYDTINGLEYIDKIVQIDQSPIGRTPRSNPGTYTGAFTYIRDWFANLQESKARGYNIGRFSFNVKGGRCERCEGDGVIKVEMHFLPDVYVECEECKGHRYNKETLEIKYKGKSIADVLEMTVAEAVVFFSNIPMILDKITALQEVGLDYMKIGQSATTLSGGEAQRVKLAKELDNRKSTGRTLYIFDEPTTGLHMHDIQKLLRVLHKLVEAENTVVVIEHNLDIIKTADCVIDVGPEGGNNGGHIVVCGSPLEVANHEASITGRYLKKIL